MKLEQLYKKAISVGIDNDLRGKKEINRILKDEKENFNGLKKAELKFFDKDRMFNPFSDTRILFGDLNLEVKKVIVGIDMEVGEVLLTRQLNQELDKKIDLIIAHHPEGYALARLFDVMKMQSDLLALFGVNISVAEHLMEQRINEVERGLMPVNHTRTVDASRLMNIPLMCIHTPSDNCVTNFLTGLFKKEKPYKLKNLMNILKDIPEYKRSGMQQVPSKIVAGSEYNKCGKIYVDMTGGTGGSKEIFEKYAISGISTLVCMHMSEEHLKNAKKANLNVVIAGHISSDVLGLNLMFDQIEKEEKFEFVGVSGFERIKR